MAEVKEEKGGYESIPEYKYISDPRYKGQKFVVEKGKTQFVVYGMPAHLVRTAPNFFTDEITDDIAASDSEVLLMSQDNLPIFVKKKLSFITG